MHPGNWMSPPPAVQLSGKEVHIWRASLAQDEVTIAELRQLLAPEERKRAERYYRSRDRRQSIVAHGFLRLIISRYLGIPATLEIAEQFFSRDEIVALRSVPEELRTLAFFNCWTRKESYVKALGEGLSHPLDCFSVSLRPDEKAALLGVDGDAHEPARWKMHALEPGIGYVAALIASAPLFSLKKWDW
jgi:4'-phosphopantetheinyl transferase